MSPPLRTARFVSLALSWAFAVIAASVGLNAVISGERDKQRYKQLAPPGVTVDIDISDVFASGCCATVASVLIGVFTFGFFVHMLITPCGPSSRFLRIQAFLLTFASLFLFGSMIPFEVFFATRSAIVKAFIGSSPVPDSVIQSIAKSLGVSGVYKEKFYLKLVAILPWFSLLFTLIAIGVLLAASRGASSVEDAPIPVTVPDSVEKEKRDDDSPRSDLHPTPEDA